MIIIEGPDGSGKTTLVSMIISAFNYKCIHSPGFINEARSNLIKVRNERIWWYERLVGLRIILDRCYIFSEWVHGPILRGSNIITDIDIIHFVKQFNIGQDSLFIFCDQEFKHEREENEKLEIESEKKLKEIQYRYKKLYSIIRPYLRYYLHVRSIKDYSYAFAMIRSFDER